MESEGASPAIGSPTAPIGQPEGANSDRADGSDRIKNAEALFEQFRMLWEDEVAHAETIRDKRKLYATGIALLLGLGVFRLSWYRNAREVPAIPVEWVAGTLKGAVAAALVLLLMAAWSIFTERKRARPWLAAIIPLPFARLECCKPDGDATDRKGRASAALDITPDRGEEFLAVSHDRAVLRRAWMLRVAYARLSKANERVNRRIGRGVSLMGASFLVLAVVIVWYSFAAGGRIDDQRDAGQNQTDDPS